MKLYELIAALAKYADQPNLPVVFPDGLEVQNVVVADGHLWISDLAPTDVEQCAYPTSPSVQDGPGWCGLAKGHRGRHSNGVAQW